jgi:RimJ/RimL family protein N-acetyltransferase
MRLVFGKDEKVAKWVCKHIPAMGASTALFGPCKAIGVEDKDGNALAGVVYHDFQEHFRTMQVSFAASSPRWATRNMVRTLLFYPFEQANVQKLWSAIQHTNARALKFSAGIGFKKEATLGDHFGRGSHAVISRMYDTDFKRLYGVKE